MLVDMVTSHTDGWLKYFMSQVWSKSCVGSHDKRFTAVVWSTGLFLRSDRGYLVYTTQTGQALCIIQKGIQLSTLGM